MRSGSAIKAASPIHYAESKERLTTPLVRKNGELAPATWDEALELVAERFKDAGEGLLTLASGRLSNEDLFNLRQLTDGLGGKTALYTAHGRRRPGLTGWFWARHQLCGDGQRGPPSWW